MRDYVQESGTYRDGSLEHEAQRDIRLPVIWVAWISRILVISDIPDDRV